VAPLGLHHSVLLFPSRVRETITRGRFLVRSVTMTASKKSIALNNLTGANWSLGIITEIKHLNDRVVVKLADGSFRQCVLKTARGVRAIPNLSLDDIYRSVFEFLNCPVAFCAARYNGRDWSADQWFVGIISTDDYMAMRIATTTEEVPF